MTRNLASRLRGVARYPRRSPATFVVLILLAINGIVVGGLMSEPAADRLLADISTNLDNLDHHPFRAMAGSLLVADVHGTLFGNVTTIGFGIGVCMAVLERRIGTVRAVGVTLLGHVGATLLTAAVLIAAIHSGTYPEDTRYTLDYGVSYASMAAIAAVTPLLPGLLRPLWALGCLLYPFSSVRWYGDLPDFTTIGHVSAALIGLGAGFAFMSRRRPDPARPPAGTALAPTAPGPLPEGAGNGRAEP
ncbi:rhomboid-like protein [Embleya scabrispora]|uniref:rhomboid-like protein n=1 Tax=Embleya scabrispora TaxID=159449 RepID=UPI001374BD59|nr:rhomboid-like protein [Embleya scabrispora]